MNVQEKIEQYKFTLTTLDLKPAHRFWIEDQLEELGEK